MIYKIKNLFLLVENQISEFDDIIYGRFSQFEQENEIKTDNYLKFNINDVQIKINGQEKILNSKIIKTDIYTIINNVISYIINDENNIYMHSVVVSNSKQGILIIGNFGQGKTTLAKIILGLYNPSSGQILIDDKARVDNSLVDGSAVFQNFCKYFFKNCA